MLVQCIALLPGAANDTAYVSASGGDTAVCERLTSGAEYDVWLSTMLDNEAAEPAYSTLNSTVFAGVY